MNTTPSSTPTPLRRLALVTGGSGGIGSAICLALSQAGFDVLIHSHKNVGKAQDIVQHINKDGGWAHALQFDQTHRAACEAALLPILQNRPIQVLVNNAGIHDDAVFPAMQYAQWQNVLDVTLHGFFNVTQTVLMPMLKTRWGRIINISSVSAQAGNRGQTNYAAAKAALHGASKSLALEVASRGVTVNVVAPGIIQAGMAKESFDAQTIAQMVPMKRAGQPEEVAALVAFLASDASAYISAQVIGVNGAMFPASS